MSAEPLLVASALAVRHGGVRALRGVDLRIAPGELVGVIGPNGAGKSSLLDAISGFAPMTGALTFAGRDVTRLRPAARARLGLGRTWQSIQLFEELTVAENAKVAQDRGGLRTLARAMLTRRQDDAGAAHAALDRVGIAALADRMPDTLSHGQRVLAGVARALAASPRLLLMDEPAAGLDADERAHLGGLLRDVVAEGAAVILVDHDMDLVLGVCDRVYVLDFGAVIAHGPPEQVRRDPRVVAAYLGDETATPDRAADGVAP